MSTTTSVFSGKRKAMSIGGRINAAIALFGGKTLDEVGFINGLVAEDVQFGSAPNPKNPSSIMNFLVLSVKGETWNIPISKGFGNIDEARKNPDWLLRCEFREGFLSVKDDEGAPAEDEHGNIRLDTSKPYLSFGKPSGLINTTNIAAFEPLTEEQLALLKSGAPLVTV